MIIAECAPKLCHAKKTEFTFQTNCIEQEKHEESKCEDHLDQEKVFEEELEIKRRQASEHNIPKNPLLRLMFKLLTIEDSCVRVLAFRMLVKKLDERNQEELLKARKLVLGTQRTQEELNRSNCSESVFNVEHLWRGLSHLYSSTPPKDRFPHIWEYPRYAAQHLMDGFSIELLDGDSNMIHLEWINEVLQELGSLIDNKSRERIFVLSVMGVQSSGKSTLLNTMFGVQLRTSVGQCTRGVNIQLLPVKGRPEYDYILLLDTEGTRSSEYHGLPGSEKRDNQMATLSILLADATIIVTPGENDAAIKEILPIVLMAYQVYLSSNFN